MTLDLVGCDTRALGGRLQRALYVAVLLLAAAAVSSPAPAAERGRIAGRVVRADGSPVSGTVVELDGRATVVTDGRGRFAFENVAVGDHELVFTLGSHVATESVGVSADITTGVEQVVDWEYVFSMTLTVAAVARRVERIVDAPAAVSVVTAEQIQREASSGQLPRLFETSPGAELPQGRLYDFKLNARGINTALNRRVAVLVDGRNPSFPLVGAQDWSAIGFPLDDLESAELVRGPSAALYGADAFSGLLDLTTKSPRDHTGGFVRLTGGELSTIHLDLGVYRQLGNGWYFKGLAGYRESDDFSRSRTDSVEYSQPCTGLSTVDCLSFEAVPLARDRNEISMASARFDKELAAGRSLVVEAGTVRMKGPVGVTAAGRFQTVDTEWPWARIDLSARHWNLLASYSSRDAQNLNLAAGSPSPVADSRLSVELQTRWELAEGRGRLVAGASYSEEDVDTADAQGRQTVLESSVEADFQALFAQFDYDISDKLKVVLAGRLEESSIYASQFSPKASLVYAVSPLHTLRVNFNEAFLTPTYPELAVRVPLLAPADLSIFEALFCSPFAVSCGFDRPVPLLAVGNGALEVEEIRTVEVGYRGILRDKAFLTVDVFDSRIENFVRTGVPLVGTSLGRANPSFGPYVPPAGLPQPVADALAGALLALPGGLGFFLTNPVPEQPIFALITLTNAGKLDTRGAELALNWQLTDEWSLDLNYTWLDFDFEDPLPEAPLGFNSPENSYKVAVYYRDDRLATSLRYRRVESYRWTEAVINGVVPSYETVSLVATYQLAEGWEVGLNVSNLFDDEHYEVFSGDLLRRRALGHVRYSW